MFLLKKQVLSQSSPMISSDIILNFSLTFTDNPINFAFQPRHCFPTWSILLVRLFTEALLSLSLQFGFSSAFLLNSFFQIDNLYPLTMSPLLLFPCPHCNFILLCSVLLRFHIVITNISFSVLIYWKHVTCLWVKRLPWVLGGNWPLDFWLRTITDYPDS